MNSKHKKIIITTIFILLVAGQNVFAQEQISPSDTGRVDISTFKKVKEIKSVFKKKNQQTEVQEIQQTEVEQNGTQAPDVQESETQQTNTQEIQQSEIQQPDETTGFKIRKMEDNSPISEFEDNDEDMFFGGTDNFEKHKKVQTTTNKTKKSFFGFLKKKDKKQNTEQKQLEEQLKEQTTQGELSEEITPEEDLTYINDGNLVYIEDVEIYGNNILNPNFIKKQISSKQGEIYVRSAVSDDLKKLYATGYFTQNIRALPIKVDNNNVKLRIILEENPPIAGFNIVGVNSISKKEVMGIFNRYKGLPQNILNINKAIEEVQELYSTKGYILARIDKVVDDPDGYINVYVDEGTIGDIIVDGNNKTRDFIVKRNIYLKPGCVYNEDTMRSDILRLMGTAAFKDVQREIKRDEETGLYNVYVALEEQRTGKISLGVGVDSASGFFGSVGFAENNFRGLGQKLNLNLLAGTGILMNDSSVVKKANLQGEISFLEPVFKRENQSLMLRGFGRYYGSYQVPLAIEKRFGAEATIARTFSTYRNLSGSISFGLENVDISEGNLAEIKQRYDLANINFGFRNKELEDGLYIKVTPALVYDTRDDVANTRRGILARLSVEENLALRGDSFGKLQGMIKKYFPVAKKSSLVFTGKAGGKIHGSMPEFAGFSLGGPYTIRGFNIAEVGVSHGYMMGSAEFRLPIPFIDRLTSNAFLNNLRIATFVDAGTLFNRSIGSKVYNKPGYAISAGVGLRIMIPGLGPINLDYGLPLTATKGVNRSHGFFTFGMGEMY